MVYNSVSVGESGNTSNEVMISFYNEDNQGNETDSILINVKKEVAVTLMEMLQHCLSSDNSNK